MDGRASTIDRPDRFGLPARVGPLIPVLAAAGWIVATSPEASLAVALDTSVRIVFWPAVWWVAARLGGALCGSRLRGASHLVWDGLCGLPVLIALWLAVGLLPGGFRPPVLGATLLLAAFVAFRWGEGTARGSGASDGTVWILGAVAAVGLVWNRVPVFFFDTLAYHYAMPELWLLDGRIAPEPWSLHSWFPPGASVLYGVGLAFGGESWAGDANLLGGLVGLGLVAELARRYWGAGAAPLAAAVALGLPMIPFAIAIPGADLWHGIFALGAVTLLCSPTASDEHGIRRAGLVAAGALLTKYLAFLVPLGLGVVWLLCASGGSATRRVRNAARFLLPAVLLFAPWMAANALRLGNPIAPVLASLLPVRGLAEGGAAAFAADARGGLPGLDDLSRLWPALFTGEPGALYPSPAWGWTLLALAPALLWGAFRDRRVRLLLGLASGWWVLWLLTYRWERFLVGVTLSIAVAAAGSLVLVWRRGGSWRLVAAGLSAIVVLGGMRAPEEILRFNGGSTVMTGRESPRAMTARVFPTTRLFRDTARLLDPTTDRVLLVGEMRHFRLRVPRAAPTGFNRHPLADALAAGDGPAAVDRTLRDRGFTHLLIDPGWVERSAAQYPSLRPLLERPQAFRAYVASLGPPLAVEGHSALFAIPGSDR